MIAKAPLRSATRLLVAGAVLAAGAYATLASLTWFRYGHSPRAGSDERDEFLDRFMPDYEVVERHHIRVCAPAPVTLAAAREQNLFELPLVRAIFKGRELVLRATPGERFQSRGLLDEVQSLGWGVLVDIPEREVVVGAITKPWEPNVRFRALPPDEFAAFREPGHVKIAWTLRADTVDETTSVFRTETRAIATDPVARERFRRYWALARPGIAMIRRLSLRPLKRDAERRARRC